MEINKIIKKKEESPKQPPSTLNPPSPTIRLKKVDEGGQRVGSKEKQSKGL